MFEEARKKVRAMIEGADTDMEKDFWQEAERLLDRLETISDDEAIRIDRDGESLYLWRGESAIQFVNTEEKKAGGKEIGEALMLATLFIRDGDSRISVVSKDEALRAKLEVMTSR